MVTAAAGLINFVGAYHNDGVIIMGRAAINQPLGPGGRAATDHTDGLKLLHHLGLGHQEGHRAKRLPSKIQIQAG